MKTTPHTISIYSQGNYLRIVRGEHSLPDTLIKPRCYPDLKAALKSEGKRPRIVNMLMQFEPDTYLERRLEAADKPVPENRYRTITQAVKSRLFLYAQVGFSSSDGKEVAYVYHRNPESQTGLQMAAKGPVEVVRKLMKKYKKAHRLRGLDFKEKTRPRIPIDPVSEQEA